MIVEETHSGFVTLSLSGKVTSRPFAQALLHFDGLITALTTELVKRDAIEWFVDDQQLDSTTFTLLAEPRIPEAVQGVSNVVTAYMDVGQALARHERPPYSNKVVREAEGIVSVLNGRIQTVRFETAETDVTVMSGSVESQIGKTYRSAYGSIEGRVQTLSSRKGLRFTLYDSLSDHAVTCYLGPNADHIMRDVWGRRALVEGWISRDPLSGRPVSVREVSKIHVLDEAEPGSYKRARGVLKDGTSDERIMEVIRRGRSGVGP